MKEKSSLSLEEYREHSRRGDAGKAIVARKIIRELIKGGILDKSETIQYAGFHHLLARGLEKKHRFGDNDTWRDAQENIVGAYKTLRERRVPMWFLKKHIKIIIGRYMWEKSSGWGAEGGRSWVKVREETPEKLYQVIEEVSLQERDIVGEIGFAEEYTHYENKRVVIDGEEYTKKVGSKRYKSEIYVIHRYGFYVGSIYQFWLAVVERYNKIYGVDCKMCGNRVKTKGQICYDLSSYSAEICEKCLKKFCKLNDGAKEVVLESRKCA